MKNFFIGGTIVDNDSQKWSYEDTTPAEVRSALRKLEDGEPITFEITSPGGSCTGGLAIANLIRKASLEGHRTTAHVIGIAASMASVIACACDEIQIDESAFFMIHNPWTIAEGNAETLRKEADTLDKFKQSLMSFYKSKFTVGEDTISRLLDAETWFTGNEAENIGLVCEVLPSKEPLRAAACMKEYSRFNNIPVSAKALLKIAERKDMNEETKDEKTTVEEEKELVEEQVEQQLEEKSDEKQEVEMVAKSVADARVSGMQSAMAKQMDSMKREYEARIQDLTNQHKAKDEELTAVKNEVTNLALKLEDATKELQRTASDLMEKENALATLNAGVNTPSEEYPSFNEGLAKCKTPKERVDFITSGKYRYN